MAAEGTTSFLLGKLSWADIPYNVLILDFTFAGVVIAGLTVLGLITYYKKWGYLWSEWFTSVDHKKIGIMYVVLSLVMLFRGFTDAIMMRTQQAIAAGGAQGYLPPHHFDQIFSAHGTIMIFFFAMAILVGLMNIAMPLQIGARDVAFPWLNNFSFWMTVSGAILINISLFVGLFSRVGWLGMAPISGIDYSPDVGVDYYIWALQIAGIGTTLSGVNMIATILKMRAPGMTLMRMPVFTWTTLCANVLIVAAFPVLTATLAMLALDRYFDMHIFTNDMGGNPMLYVNLIWIWGHPEVYILILPCFGIFSEVVSTFSGKPLFGYRSMVYATACIMVLSFIVWLHHFFTMGSGANVNTFFGITTMIIAVPTGAKIFNWLFTMYRGHIRIETPMYWTIGFLITFTIGGMTGVMLAVPPADFQLHNTLFLVAHFHNVIIGGVVFGAMAGFTYWWPKMFGFKLDDKWGRRSFWFWCIGFYFAFMPLYVLGLMGVTRRLQSYSDVSWQIYFIIACFGAFLIALGIASTVIQIVVSIKNREQLKCGPDPWDGRSLEWATASPCPPYNFPGELHVRGRDEWWRMKKEGFTWPADYKPIHMPKYTWAGIVPAAICLILGFALVWHIWWLVVVSFVATIGSIIAHTFNFDRDYYIPAEVVAETEAKAKEAYA